MARSGAERCARDSDGEMWAGSGRPMGDGAPDVLTHAFGDEGRRVDLAGEDPRP